MAKENEKNNANQLPDSAIQFIENVINKIRYRRKIRTDVQNELIAHFEDELQECKTGQERDEKAKELIKEFGEVKLLATLIRRAKKRCRPLWRTMIARIFQIAVVLILCLFIYIAWFFSGKPAITRNYVAELNNISIPKADESLNAAPLYDKAAEMLKKDVNDINEYMGILWADLNAEQKKVVEKWFEDNKDILKLVTDGTQKPYFWRKHKEQSDMMGIIIPNLVEFRMIARIITWHMWMNAEHNRFKEAFLDIKTCFLLGQHLRGNVTLIEQLVGISIESMSARNTRELLNIYVIDKNTLAEFQQDYELMTERKDFTLQFKAESLGSYDVIQRAFTDGFGRDHIIPKVLKQLYPEAQVLLSSGTVNYPPAVVKQTSWFSDILSDICDITSDVTQWVKKNGYLLFLHPDKEETYRTVQQMYDYVEKMKSMTPAQLHAEGVNLEEKLMNIAKGNLLLVNNAPAIARINEICYHNKAEIEATLVVLSLVRFNREHGNYPQNLEQLAVENYIKKLPMDPFSNKPFVYKINEQNFILYSTGSDCKDNGGEVFRDKGGQVRTWGKSGDAVLWPVTRPEE
ncbi:MAG: hypothetical protein JW787_08445 [Sedimentisphaerales bacterium]|nr:hypothetical protein [Sedimentisphaerales bacterium]